MTRFLRSAGAVLFIMYMFIAGAIATPYFSWKFAQDHGFLPWLFFGAIVPTVKGVAWPYFVYVAHAELPEASSQTVAAVSEPRLFKCNQPIPEFTLGPTSNPSDAELAKLCACVWSKLPEGGWEREVSAKIRRGEDAGWRMRAFASRFGPAIDACGGRSL